MSLLNSAVGNVSSNTSNMPQSRKAASPSASSSASSSSSSSLSYSATGNILIDKGQIVKGEITDIRNNTVSIKVDLGETITYPLEGEPELTIGQNATFKAVETPEGIALRALSQKPSIARLATINKALEEAGLQKNERNQTIVLELLNNQMSIDKQSIQRLFQQSLLNKNASISTLVLMLKHNIPINDKTSTQFENYRNFEHRMIQDIDTLSDEIPKLLDKVCTFTTSKNFLSINSQVMDIILNGNRTILDTPLSTVISAKDGQSLVNILKPFSLTDDLEGEILTRTASVSKVSQTIQDSIMMAERIDQQKQEELFQSKMQSQDADIHTVNGEPKEIPITEVFQSPIIRKILEQHTNLQFSNNELSTFLSLQNRQILSMGLKNFGITDEIKQGIELGTITTGDLLEEINRLLSDANANDVKSLYSSKVFQWVLKEHIKSNLTMTVNDLMDNRVNSFYDDLYRQVQQMNQLLDESGLKDVFSSFANTSSNMRDNLDFMNTLNHLFPYMQLPIKLKDHNIHSDLYVYTKKKDLRQNNENVSVLLHLDMENLGSTDIHITLSRSNVLAKFYLSDDTSTELIRNNIDLLEEALNQKGYVLQTEFLKKEKEIDIVEDIIEKDMPATSLKRYSFDIRA